MRSWKVECTLMLSDGRPFLFWRCQVGPGILLPFMCLLWGSRVDPRSAWAVLLREAVAIIIVSANVVVWGMLTAKLV